MYRGMRRAIIASTTMAAAMRVMIRSSALAIACQLRRMVSSILSIRHPSNVGFALGYHLAGSTLYLPAALMGYQRGREDMSDEKKTEKVYIGDNYVPTTVKKSYTPSSGAQGNYQPTSTGEPKTTPPAPKKK